MAILKGRFYSTELNEWIKIYDDGEIYGEHGGYLAKIYSDGDIWAHGKCIAKYDSSTGKLWDKTNSKHICTIYPDGDVYDRHGKIGRAYTEINESERKTQIQNKPKVPKTPECILPPTPTPMSSMGCGEIIAIIMVLFFVIMLPISIIVTPFNLAHDIKENSVSGINSTYKEKLLVSYPTSIMHKGHITKHYGFTDRNEYFKSKTQSESLTANKEYYNRRIESSFTDNTGKTYTTVTANIGITYPNDEALLIGTSRTSVEVYPLTELYRKSSSGGEVVFKLDNSTSPQVLSTKDYKDYSKQCREIEVKNLVTGYYIFKHPDTGHEFIIGVSND